MKRLKPEIKGEKMKIRKVRAREPVRSSEKRKKEREKRKKRCESFKQKPQPSKRYQAKIKSSEINDKKEHLVA